MRPLVLKMTLVSIFFAFYSSAKANNMTIFLKSAAYGTAAGATLGLATLAWSENPSSKISNVARGASLGLYAGIGFGLYAVYGQPSNSNSDYSQLPFQMWLTPVGSNEKIDGAQLNWAQLTF